MTRKEVLITAEELKQRTRVQASKYGIHVTTPKAWPAEKHKG